MADNNEPQAPSRPIRTLKGLLKFCMESTKNEDTTSDTDSSQLPPEKREWLENALKSMTINTTERIGECLKNIEEAKVDTEEGTEQIITALEELQDWVEDMDIAKDFITLKGLRVIPGLLGSEVSEIRWRCLELMANISQNNPKVQATLLAAQYLPVLLHMIENDDNPTVKVKAMYALSCLSRSHHMVQMSLFSSGGLEVVVKALQSDEEKLRIKASFLLFALSQDNPALKDCLLDRNLVEPMVEALKGEHCMSHEHLMNAFVSLAENHQRFREFCLQEKVDLKSFLTKKIRELEGKEETQDERNHAEKFLALLNSSSQSSSSQGSNSTNSAMALLPA